MNIIPYRKGKPITESGIYSGVPIDVYHGANLCDGPSISSSGLRTIFNDSPAHYWSSSPYNPECEAAAESSAFTLGRAAHHLLLGEDDFSTTFIMRPDEIDGAPWQGNRTACKAWIKQQEAERRTVLKPDDIRIIRGMAKALAAHPLIDNGILNGLVEHTMVWRCKDTGVWKKARPDCIPNDSGDFADLKTTVSVKFDDVQRTLADYGYHQQGALICEGYHALTGNKESSFTLVFVEKSPPYCVRVTTLWNEDLARGELQNSAATDLFVKGFKKNEWPGPGGTDAEYMALPEWMQKRIDRRIDEFQWSEK